MTPGALVLAAFVVLAQEAGPGAVDSELDAIRQLYTTAAYQEALTRLAGLEGRGDPDRVDQYRALCLIGLGRTAEADQTLEGIVLRSPQFKVQPNEASPAFLARFASVRKRILPIAAKRAYTKARTSYDLKDYSSAVTQLHDLLSLLRGESAADPVLADLQQVAEGFLRLTEAELAVANRKIYTSFDADVTPPVELERKLPAWAPPDQYRWRWFRGIVQVVIDERGSVENAMLVQSLADFYDADLLQAARDWRFKPAQRSGQPVKYRKLVEITMRPQ